MAEEAKTYVFGNDSSANSKDLMCDDCRLNFYNYGRVKIKIKGELN